MATYHFVCKLCVLIGADDPVFTEVGGGVHNALACPAHRKLYHKLWNRKYQRRKSRAVPVRDCDWCGARLLADSDDCIDPGCVMNDSFEAELDVLEPIIDNGIYMPVILARRLQTAPPVKFAAMVNSILSGATQLIVGVVDCTSGAVTRVTSMRQCYSVNANVSRLLDVNDEND